MSALLPEMPGFYALSLGTSSICRSQANFFQPCRTGHPKDILSLGVPLVLCIASKLSKANAPSSVGVTGTILLYGDTGRERESGKATNEAAHYNYLAGNRTGYRTNVRHPASAV